jgi:hypothetical protein
MQETSFRAVLWRKAKAAEQVTGEVTGVVTQQVTDQAIDLATEQATEQVTEQVKRLVLILANEMSRQKMMEKLDLKHRPTFIYTYIQPSIDGKWIEMTIPENPNDPNQKYRLTVKGKQLKKQIKKK